jgi:hypothetical protein
MSVSGDHFPEQPWYSYQGGKYDGVMPPYFDRNDFRWLEDSEQQFAKVKSAVEDYLRKRNKSLDPYFLNTHSTRKDSWKGLTFYSWGKRMPVCNEVPEIEQFFLSMPGMISAAISQLEAHSEIDAHCGDTNTVIRFHMGLRVPAGLPECGIVVRGEKQQWTEGRWLIFCDAHEHAVWNKTDTDRYVFIVDLIHPALLHQRKNICSNGISINKIQQLDLKKPWVAKLPGPVRGAIRHWYKFAAWLSL